MGAACTNSQPTSWARIHLPTARPSFAGGVGPLDRTVVVAQFPGMVTRPRTWQPFEPQSPFRLMVKARTPIGRKSGFVWEIIRNDTEQRVVSRSSVSYSSMEDACEHGAIEINSGEYGMFRVYSGAALPASLWPGLLARHDRECLHIRLNRLRCTVGRAFPLSQIDTSAIIVRHKSLRSRSGGERVSLCQRA